MGSESSSPTLPETIGKEAQSAPTLNSTSITDATPLEKRDRKSREGSKSPPQTTDTTPVTTSDAATLPTPVSAVKEKEQEKPKEVVKEVIKEVKQDRDTSPAVATDPSATNTSTASTTSSATE